MANLNRPAITPGPLTESELLRSAEQSIDFAALAADAEAADLPQSRWFFTACALVAAATLIGSYLKPWGWF